ncbi:glutamate receptor ionotropic, NMDA 3A-like [Tachypleus tridentatus]|uniref:glutamate receptor ionotropic, NMDA 3A-like n=1 Tax=Tachypleus tridentatus TaxID=6853 RepID=UPI003FCF6544
MLSIPGKSMVYWYVLVLLVVAFRATGLVLPLLAAFPPASAPHLSRVLRRAMGEADTKLSSKNVTLLARWVTLPNNTQTTISVLCEAIERNSPALILNFVDRPMSFFPSLVSGYTGVPLIGMTSGYLDQTAKDVNPMYLSLDPVVTDLADGVFQLINSSKWYDVILVADDSETSSSLVRHLGNLMKRPLWRPLLVIRLQKKLSEDEILNRLSDVVKSFSRVILLHCDKELAEKVFKIAGELNLLSGEWIWIVLEQSVHITEGPVNSYPAGLLAIRLRSFTANRHRVRTAVRILTTAIHRIEQRILVETFREMSSTLSCFNLPTRQRQRFSHLLHSSLKNVMYNRNHSNHFDYSTHQSRRHGFSTVFEILNLAPSINDFLHWQVIGNISGLSVRLNTVLWVGSGRMEPWPTGRQRFRVTTSYNPPFVQKSTRVSNGSCLMGIPCLQVRSNRKDELVSIFADYAQGRAEGETYNVTCCSGITMDLLTDLARDLDFDYDLYLVADGMFGTSRGGEYWNGITADLISGAAHLTFSSFSITSIRYQVIDFSVPYFHSGVSCLASSKLHDVPLSAFLVPFSVHLWVAIFASLNVTAFAAAIYEWLSPFGLNPWGRQRTKNFSLASALWVMWSLLFSHLVAFKAPKSWPNKVLINLWGCFSVIFLASYTANIAALFAGLFFQLRVDDLHDSSLLNQRTGAAKGSAAEGYVFSENTRLWQHIQKYEVETLEGGLDQIRNGELDVLIGDTAVLDYFRGNEPGCNLHLLGDPIFDDAYAIGMQKGFPLKDAISDLILRYNEFGYIDQLQQKWYGRVPCFGSSVHSPTKPMGLSIRAVAGVFIMLLVGLLVGICILLMEHLVFRYVLPKLREGPEDAIWRSPNLMFLSQKLYRFINTVELVSPHHSAKEIASNLREGQIFSLFQKSVKRKAKEDLRRRKSKSQFSGVIQEIRNVVHQEQERRILASTNDLVSSTSIENIPSEATPLDDYSNDRRIECDKIPAASLLENKVLSEDSGQQKRLLVSSRKLAQSFPSMSIPQPSNTNVSSSSSPITSSSSTFPSLSHLHDRVFSFSLNDLSPNCSKYSQQRKVADRCIKRPCSFSDLRTLKTRPRPDDLDASNMKFHPNYRNFNLYLSSYQKYKPILFLQYSIDDQQLYSLSKEEIIHRWRTTERQMLNRLREALKQKAELEEKLSYLKKTLLQPP